MSRRTRFAALAATACLGVALQCQRTPTQVHLTFTTNVPCNDLSLRFYAAGEPAFSTYAAESAFCSAGALGDIYVYPTGDGTQAYLRVLLGLQKPARACESDLTGCIEQKRDIAYASGEVLELPVALNDVCKGVGCGTRETCNPTTGKCVPFDVTCVGGRCGLIDEIAALTEGGVGGDGGPGGNPGGPAHGPVVDPTELASDAITVGDGFGCVITGADRQVWCWGSSFMGEHGDQGVSRNGEPTRVGSGPGDPGSLAGATSVAANGHTACAVFRGVVSCWGSNKYSQVGDGDTFTPVTMPKVRSLPAMATSVALGRKHACAVITGGNVYCWGTNDYGQIGQSPPSVSPSPLLVPDLMGAERVAAGTQHSCALVPQGKVRCWGSNFSYESGRDTGGVGSAVVSSTNALAAPVTNVHAGYELTCAPLIDQRTTCFGYNARGQAGVMPQPDAVLPSLVTIDGVLALSTGLEHSCAITRSGVKCWGSNQYRQLGIDNAAAGGSSFSSTPVYVEGLDGFEITGIAGGERGSCARDRNGAVKCWGGGSGIDSAPGYVPTNVAGLP